jgi:putative Holliday junction resolvase
MPRILGVDYGERRIGLAVSDVTGTIANPLPTILRRRGKRPPVARIAETARELGVERIVVGLPLTSEGEEDEWTREVRDFGEKLASRTGLPVDYIDERFTSARAERTLRELGLKSSKRREKGLVDATAAVLILQAYLDRRMNV